MFMKASLKICVWALAMTIWAEILTVSIVNVAQGDPNYRLPSATICNQFIYNISLYCGDGYCPPI